MMEPDKTWKLVATEHKGMKWQGGGFASLSTTIMNIAVGPASRCRIE
jgi:hypothetical protein